MFNMFKTYYDEYFLYAFDNRDIVISKSLQSMYISSIAKFYT